MKQQIALIGYGYWGPNLVRNFSSIKDVSVKYIVDIDEKRLKAAKEMYPGVNATKDYMEAITDGEVTSIIISTPVSSHYKFALAALENRKHVLLEKPITASASEANSLIKSAREKQRILMVDHTFEYSKPVQKIYDYIRNNELGDIFSISMSRLNLGLFQKDINVIWDLCPHDISILLYLLKKMPVSVSAVGMDHVNKGIEDDCHVFLKFENRITASMHVSWLDPCKVRRVAIVGSKKMLLFDDVEPLDKIKLYDKSIIKTKNGLPVMDYYTNLTEFQLSYKYGDVLIPKIDFKEPLSEMANHFISCIRENKTPVSDGLSGLRVIRIIEAAQESLKNGGKEIKIKSGFDELNETLAKDSTQVPHIDNGML